jgi:hypothetical protein
MGPASFTPLRPQPRNHRKHIGKTACLLPLLGIWATAQNQDYFLHPPGCEWGSLLFTNAAAYSLSATPSGYALAGRCEHPTYGSDTAVALLLSPEGYPGYAAFFPGVARSEGGRHPTEAFCIAPSYGTNGQADGYLVGGYKTLLFHGEEDPRQQWANPALWVARLDAGLNPIWDQTLEAPHGRGRWGSAVIWDQPGFYMEAGCLIVGAETFLQVGRAHFHACSGGCYGMAMRLHGDGTLHWHTVRDDPEREWLSSMMSSVAPLQWGGYVFGTSSGVCMTSSGLTPQWLAAETHHFFSVKLTADGGFIGVGTQNEGPPVVLPSGLHTFTDMILTKLDAGGAVEWTRTFGLSEEDDSGHDVTTAPGGDFLLVGEAGKPGDPSRSDAVVVRVSPSGELRWDLRLGGSQHAAAYSVVQMPGNAFLMAGAALGRMWLFKLRGNLGGPAPFVYLQPRQPLFCGTKDHF